MTRRLFPLAALASALAIAAPATAVDRATATAQAPAAAAPRAALPDDARFVELRMRGRRYAPEQARDAVTAVLEVPATQTILIARDGRFRMETDTRYPGAIEFRYLTVGSRDGSATVDPLHWRDGIEISRDDADGARNDRADLLFLAPALLLRDARERKAITDDGLRPEGVNATGGARTIAFSDAAGRPATLTIQTATGRIDGATSGDRQYAYADYRMRGGMLQPARIEIRRQDRAKATWERVDARVLAQPAADAFALPAGYVEQAARGALRATPLGSGAYRIDGAASGYHTGFVVGERAVAVFDAPVSVEEAAKTRALILRTAPGRRIAYVVVSHAHGDHVAGLPAYQADGARVMAGAHARIALRRQFGDKLTLPVAELAATRRLDLGGRELVLAPLASTHAESMLVGYDPVSRSVFQGDLFYLPEVGPVPPAFDGAAELSRLIAEQAWKVEHIVGAHGRSGDADDLRASLRLREEAKATD